MDFEIGFRPLRLEDAKFVNELRLKESIERMLGGVLRPVAFERDVKWVEDLILKDNQSIIYYAITEASNDAIIGYISVADIDYRNGTCFYSGIKLDPDKAKKGYGTQATLKILKYVFEELRMMRCSAVCLEHHKQALKMMENAGYVKEGLMRQTVYKNGVQNNQWLLSVVRDDYAAIKDKFKL